MKSNEKLIYLASPYSHPDKEVMEARYKETLRVTAEMTKNGLLVYSPIVHSHPMAMEHDMPKGFEFWSKFNFGMLDHCDIIAVLTLDGWKNSKGVVGEIKHATLAGLDFFYVHPELCTLSRTLIELNFSTSEVNNE